MAQKYIAEKIFDLLKVSLLLFFSCEVYEALYWYQKVCRRHRLNRREVILSLFRKSNTCCFCWFYLAPGSFAYSTWHLGLGVLLILVYRMVELSTGQHLGILCSWLFNGMLDSKSWNSFWYAYYDEDGASRLHFLKSLVHMPYTLMSLVTSLFTFSIWLLQQRKRVSVSSYWCIYSEKVKATFFCISLDGRAPALYCLNPEFFVYLPVYQCLLLGFVIQMGPLS